MVFNGAGSKWIVASPGIRLDVIDEHRIDAEGKGLDVVLRESVAVERDRDEVVRGRAGRREIVADGVDGARAAGQGHGLRIGRDDDAVALDGHGRSRRARARDALKFCTAYTIRCVPRGAVSSRVDLSTARMPDAGRVVRDLRADEPEVVARALARHARARRVDGAGGRAGLTDDLEKERPQRVVVERLHVVAGWMEAVRSVAGRLLIGRRVEAARDGELEEHDRNVSLRAFVQLAGDVGRAGQPAGELSDARSPVTSSASATSGSPQAPIAVSLRLHSSS